MHRRKPGRTILQIIPAEGWEAAYWRPREGALPIGDRPADPNNPPVGIWSEPLACWALVNDENDDIGTWQTVVGFDPDPEAGLVDETANFIGYRRQGGELGRLRARAVDEWKASQSADHKVSGGNLPGSGDKVTCPACKREGLLRQVGPMPPITMDAWEILHDAKYDSKDPRGWIYEDSCGFAAYPFGELGREAEDG